MAKEEILHAWLSYAGKAIEHYFLYAGKVIDNEKLFQYPFPEQLWANISNFIDNLARTPMWVDRQASSTIFGAKQTYSFWQSIFESGRSTAGHKILPSGLNITEMIKP